MLFRELGCRFLILQTLLSDERVRKGEIKTDIKRGREKGADEKIVGVCLEPCAS